MAGLNRGESVFIPFDAEGRAFTSHGKIRVFRSIDNAGKVGFFEDCLDEYAPVKHGHWEPSPDGVNPILCSECNMPAPFAFLEDEFGDTGFYRYPWNYCPYCGAPMQMEEDRERR